MDIGTCSFAACKRATLFRYQVLPPMFGKKTRCLNVHLEKFSAFSHISPPPESCLISLLFGRLYAVVIKKMDFEVLIAPSMSPHVSYL